MSVEVRISLAGAEFPADPREAPLVALQPALDTASRANSVYVGKTENLDWGMPGVIYLENAVPKLNGYATLSASAYDLGFTNPYTFLADVAQFAGIESVGAFLIGVDATLICRLGVMRRDSVVSGPYFWQTMPPNTSYNKVSCAVVNGEVFVLPAGQYITHTIDLYVYSGSTFNPQTLSLPPGGRSTVRAIASLGNYLMLFGDDEITYSAPGAPTDFVSIGAGNFTPTSYEGYVVAAHAIANGVIVYTTVGAWLITQTFNGANPFKSTQIPGITGSYQVASCPSTDVHFAHTTTGLFEVSARGATPILEHLWRSLGDTTYSIYNPASERLDISTLSPSIQSAITLSLVANRYLVITSTRKSISYIYDLTLRRLGKINGGWKFAANISTSVTPRRSSEFVMTFFDAANGYANYTADHVPAAGGNFYARSGVVVIGPIVQQRNDRQSTITQVTLTNTLQPGYDATPTVVVLSSTGDISQATNHQVFTPNGTGNWLGRITGRYLYVVLRGAVDVSNLLVKVTANGY